MSIVPGESFKGLMMNLSIFFFLPSVLVWLFVNYFSLFSPRENVIYVFSIIFGIILTIIFYKISDWWMGGSA